MKKLNAGIVLIAFLVGFQISGLTQIPSNPLGLNPNRLSWQQIETDRVQVIFPEETQAHAQRVANLVHYLWDHHNESVGEKKQSVTIILHNLTTNPNGFVTVGPFRSEFYLTPPQFNCTTNWLDLLTIHEYRHVKQFGNTRRGLTKLARSIFGSWAWGGFLGMALPRWYLEGDAVVQETALTSSGRGRLPAFNMEYRALVLNDIYYNYEKASAGSFKDFVPNWYRLGYYMTAFARREFGKDIWSEVVEDAARYKGLFYSFSNSLQRKTGLGTPELYQATRMDLDSLWKMADAKQSTVSGVLLNHPAAKNITNYNNPHYACQDQVVVQKSGYDLIPGYYVIDSSGEEIKLTNPGGLLDLPFSTLSVSGDLLCWAELSFGSRWRNEQFSIIRTYDITTGKKRKLTSRSRYFSPSLSPDGRKIVAVEITPGQKYQLAVLDARTGEEIRKLINEDNWLYAYPRWTPDGSAIVTVALRGEKNHLQLIDEISGQVTALTVPSYQQITHPWPGEKYVFFSGAHTGINNIFALDLESRKLFQLTDVQLGAFQPSVSSDGQRLLFSDFTVEGYNIREFSLEEAQWKEFRGDDPEPLVYFETMARQEGGSIVDKVPADTFPVKKFNTWQGIINPHSLLPFASPPLWGLQVLSDNKFSTLSADGGIFYNTNESEWTYLAGFTYAELFAEIRGNYRHANRSSVYYNFAPDNDTTILANFYVEEWTEDDVSGGLSLPLNLSQGPFFNSMLLRADYHRIGLNIEGRFDEPGNFRDTITVANGQNSEFQEIFRDRISDATLNTVDLRFIFRSFRRRALQHLNPRWGINLDLRYRSVFGSDLQGGVLLARADFFMPGLSRNHSFYINTMFQREEMLDNYRFSNVFFYPRGYSDVLADKIYKIGVNYTIPVWHPDLALGPAAFLKRVKANVFYDYGWLDRDFPFTGDREMRSAGVELTVDFRAFRLLEIDLGLRYSFLFDEDLEGGQRNQFDFLLISITE